MPSKMPELFLSHLGQPVKRDSLFSRRDRTWQQACKHLPDLMQAIEIKDQWLHALFHHMISIGYLRNGTAQAFLYQVSWWQFQILIWKRNCHMAMAKRPPWALLHARKAVECDGWEPSFPHKFDFRISCILVCVLKHYWFFVFWCGPFFKSLLNLLQYCFVLCFGFLVTRHVGSYLPYQGSNPHPLHWKAKS